MESTTVVGIDEAGRGALAGPVVACALHYDHTIITGLKDSKQLNESRREQFFEILNEVACFGIGVVSAQEVDKSGIKKATHHAMQLALRNLTVTGDFIIVDGNDHFTFELPHISIIKGDDRFQLISAASIIAKVARDHIMHEYALLYPKYGFEKHKGYGTKVHMSNLERYGASPIHRMTYEPVAAYAKKVFQ